MSHDLIDEISAAFGCDETDATEVVTTIQRISTRAESLLAERNLLSDTAAFMALRAEWKARGCPTDHPYARLCADVVTDLIGCRVIVPADPNGRVATVTEQAAQGGRWRIDWHEPITHQHRWGWWDTNQLIIVATAGDVLQHEIDRADAHMDSRP